MTAPVSAYLDSSTAPAERIDRSKMSATTRELHDSIDAQIRAHGTAYLHPQGASVQTDLFTGKAMRDWQVAKGDAVLSGDSCWSSLPHIYARYGTVHGQRLMAQVAKLERAEAVVLTDSGAQATALLLDTLVQPGDHVLMSRQVYNKTKAYLDWLAQRMDIRTEILDEVSPQIVRDRAGDTTRLLFVETYTNPLMRAIDPNALSDAVVELRAEKARRLRLLVDNTIATPWGLEEPLLSRPGIDFVVAAGTKALAGQDRDMWGYVASDDFETMNSVMDLQAMRGGRLSWRAAEAIATGLDAAEGRARRRCATAEKVVEFLRHHPRVEQVFHPAVPEHPDRAAIDQHYALTGSLISLRVVGADEDATGHFCDVLAMTGVFRYALSFDGLTSKVNHHKTVSEYYAPKAALEKQGIDRLARLAIGVEDPDDLIACLNWALWNASSIDESEVASWVIARKRDLDLAR